MRRLLLLAAIPAALLLASPSPASAFSCANASFTDDFNRADNTNLGAGWVETGTDLAIAANRVTDPATTEGFALAVGASGNVACADVAADPSAGVQYAALVLRGSSDSSNVFVKVQDSNADHLFEGAFFYLGNNGSSGSSVPQPLTPFASGRMYVAAVGNQVTLEISTSGDDAAEQTLTKTITPPGPTGTGVGIGAFGGASLDNFVSMQDADLDGVPDTSDNCVNAANAGQANNDGDADGDVCDLDDDNDGVVDTADGCPTVAGTTDADHDGCTDPAPPPATPTPLASPPATCSRQDVTIAGTSGADTLTGTAGPDVIAGLGGADTIKGLGGDDVICGNTDGDKIHGGSGDDLLRGGKGHDSIVGGPGNDTINPGHGLARGPKDRVVP